MSATTLSALTGLFEQPGPFVTIYLETESAVEDAAARLETRWKDVVRDLQEQGVDDATIEALTAARGGHELGGTRVLIAAGGAVQYARSLPEGTDTTLVRVGPLPYLLPLIDWAQTGTISTLFSGLAAQAAVLHLDGIAHRPLLRKLSGVYDSRQAQDGLLPGGRSALGDPARKRADHGRLAAAGAGRGCPRAPLQPPRPA